ncbi:MAG: hypothetical protein PHX54_02350 [Lentimicrobiaceae bacterium]|nr:hypothetical protein [Lentimicrobiaceae bacterium]
MIRLVFVFFAFLTATFSGFATNYYVAVSGNDNNNGTIEAPWGTWQKAFSTARREIRSTSGEEPGFQQMLWLGQIRQCGIRPILNLLRVTMVRQQNEFAFLIFPVKYLYSIVVNCML